MTEHRKYLSVSDLNSKIRYSLEKDLSSIWVKGELSNFHHHPSSGHMYFTLKDELNEIRCAMFRANNQFLKFIPLDGMSIRLFGDITLYEQRGSIQIKVSIMEEDGIGDLHVAFEKMKDTLEQEGLFDQKYKKPLPLYPKRIGIITSESGAAIKDICNVLGRRAPQVKLILKSVKVQGHDSPKQISEAIELFNNKNCVDVLIIGRGGGSIEDLFAFNEEIVARTIFKSLIPIISAVGHETDFSISDFVSDVRAPTPSAAAEIAVVSKDTILKNLRSLEKQIIDSIRVRMEKYWLKKDQLERRMSVSKPQARVQNSLELLDKYYERLIYINKHNFSHYQNHLESLLKRLVGLGPDNVLERGFSIPTDSKGNIIKSPDQIKVGDRFNLKTAKGSLQGRKI
tara:strand:- start:353 stop:1546 length:1194 start_codon:yes stop_codon:yes gene_type:complete